MFSKPIFVSLCGSAALVVGAGAEPLGLGDALRLGLKNHPDVLVADSSLKVRVAETLAFSEVPNPRLEAEFRALTDQPAIELRLMQPLRRSYFGLRQNYAVAERAAAQADARAVIVGVLNDVFARHAAVWAAQARREVFSSSIAELVSLRPQLARAVDAGQASAVDLALLDGQSARLAAEMAAVEPERLAAVAALARRIGRNDDIQVEAPVLVPLPATSTALERFATTRTPLRSALLARQTAARARLRVALDDRLGPMEAGVIAEHDTDRAESVIGIGFSIDLPFWNRNEAAIATAESQLSGTQADLLVSEPERMAALVRLRHRAAVAAESAAREYQENVLPAYATALAKAREALERAQADPGQIERVITLLGEARLRALELRVAALEARSELESALGGRIEEALTTPQR
jgi:cobalt-zinc-cadmium efflux system outer membrane protein